MVDRVNVCDLYLEHARDTLERTALIDAESGTSLSYGEFDDRVSATGAHLESLGIGRGDRVALVYPNSVRYIEVLFGAMRLGAVPVPVGSDIHRERLADIFDDCDPAVVLVDDSSDALSTVEHTLGADATDRIVVDPTGGDESFESGPYRTLGHPRSETDTPSIPVADTSGSDPALQPYTSGSTGRPKGVVLSHEGICWNSRALSSHLSLDAGMRSLVCTPLHHKNAMSIGIKPMLSAGGAVVIVPEFDATTVCRSLVDYDVTYLTGVPTIYSRLIDAASELDLEYPALEWGTCGSAPVPATQIDSFRNAFGAELLEVYGLTEGGPNVTHSPRFGPREPSSAGTTLPGVETVVVEPGTCEQRPRNEPGELLVTNPGLGTYYERDGANESSFERINGTRYLRTGDVVRKDDNGYHFVVDRLDNMFQVGGKNVYPAEIEDLLSDHDAVKEVAVVPLSHEDKGKAPVAYVVPQDDVSEEDLKQFTIQRADPIKHPRRIFFVSSLPIRSTKKVDKKELLKEARNRIDCPL